MPKSLFHKTSYICFQGGTEHYHAVLGADLGNSTGQGQPTEVTHTSRECCTWVAEEIIDVFTTNERYTLPWSCKLCGVYPAPADPTQFENRAVTLGDYCPCQLNAPSFLEQARNRICDFLLVANKVNNLSDDIKNKSEKEGCLSPSLQTTWHSNPEPPRT